MREFIKEYLNRVRPDLKIKTGSPLENLIVDPLAALLPLLDQKISTKYQIGVEELATLYLLERNYGEPSESIVRLYFTESSSLSYNQGEMVFYDGNGYLYSNKESVNVTSSRMSVYTEDSYYYADITVVGDNPLSTTTTLEWQYAPETFSYLSIKQITVPGYLPETDEDLNRRIAFQTSNRFLVTSPGAQAYYSDKYPGKIRDILSIGFGDAEMMRDIKLLDPSDPATATHLGGYVDIYMKADLPVDRTLTRTVGLLPDRKFEESVSTIFETTSESLIYKNLVDASVAIVTAESQVVTGRTFTEDTHFTINRLAGLVEHIDNSADTDIMRNADYNGGGAALWDMYISDPPRVLYRNNSTALPNYNGAETAEGTYLRVVDDDGDEFWYIIQSYEDDGTNFRFIVDRDIEGVAPYALYGYEPVTFTFKYHPQGFELSDFDNPVIWIDKIVTIDPLTGKPYDPEVIINHKGGYGYGVYGGGGYGTGSTQGWKLHVDDENLRYSIEETGVVEFIGDYSGLDVEVHYRYASNIADFQLDADNNRSIAADVLVKSFIPVLFDFSIDATPNPGITEITGLDTYVWLLSSRIELSDVINQLYTLGVSFVDIGDLTTSATFVKWKIDGTFETRHPDTQGVLDLNDRTSRLLPGQMQVNLS